MHSHRFFRIVAAAVLMCLLLSVYGAHPVAGWAMLVTLFVLTIVSGRKSAMTPAVEQSRE